jgi:hypothetical protein
MVLTISNYSWFEKVKERPNKSLKCTPADFDIGFKLSSSTFATSLNASKDYHFDKNGVRFTYNQFYRLMRSEIFTQEYLNKIKKYYQRDQNMNIDSIVVVDEEGEEEEEDEDEPKEVEESDEENVPLQSVKSAIVKRLKRL